MTPFVERCRSIQPRAYRTRPRPKSTAGFIPRATRRNSIRGAVPGWRTIWQATGGYPDLVKAFAEEVAKRRAAAQ